MCNLNWRLATETMSDNSGNSSAIEGEKLMVCEADQKPAAQVELKVNGKEIELNNFVENFIAQTVIGMVRSLRGVSDIDTVNLQVSKKAKDSQA